MSNELMHSRTKGSKNKKGHKYIEIRNGRYIYKDDKRPSHGGSSGKTGDKAIRNFTQASSKEEKQPARITRKQSQYNGTVKRITEKGKSLTSTKKRLMEQRVYNKAVKPITEKGKAQTKYTKKNAKNLWRENDQKRIAKANKKNAKVNRSAAGSTNSQKLLANQRKKQRSLGSKVVARAKKLARALNRTIKYAPKNIASIPRKKANKNKFNELLRAGRSTSTTRYQTAKGKAWKKARAAQKKIKLPSLKKKR